MRNFLALMLLAGACCLVSSQEARSDVNAITEVSYYEPTNSIRVMADTMASYDTLAYYDVSHWGQVNKDDTALTGFSGGVYDGIDAYYEEYFPYDPNAEYTIEAYPQLVLKVRHDYGDQYEDYYNYVLLTYSDPALSFPGFFGFTGPGPDVGISGNSISLGTVYSLFTEGATAGPPHHLKVDNDEIKEAQGGCGQKERNIKYLVVDETGRKAGKVSVGETFPSTIISSCTNQSVQPQACSWFGGGMYHPFFANSSKFTDHLRVGCPAETDDCGFSVSPDTWVWCKPPDYGPQRVTLARINIDVRKRTITVNGRDTKWDKGTEFFP